MSRSAPETLGLRSIALDRRPTLHILRPIVSDPLVRSNLAGRSRLYLCDPVLINAVLVRNAGRLSKGVVSRRVLRPVLGNGMLTAAGAVLDNRPGATRRSPTG